MINLLQLPLLYRTVQMMRIISAADIQIGREMFLALAGAARDRDMRRGRG